MALSFLQNRGDLDPRQHQPPLPVLSHDYDKSAILSALQSISIDGSATFELAGYATEDCERFMHTIALIPPNAGNVLEIGANPYFTTMLAKWFRPELAFTLTNYFNGDTEEREQTVVITHPSGTPETHRMSYLNVNVESVRLPYPDDAFDCILFCEVLEHLTNDPMATMVELRRVLKPTGSLVLTTPNVARLENVARIVAGANIYDPYSGYGPYGRHNREYTRHELFHFLRHCGFEAELMFTADVSQNRTSNYLGEWQKLTSLLAHRAADLGQYHFTRWTKGAAPSSLKPGWLYRSLPAHELDPTPI